MLNNSPGSQPQSFVSVAFAARHVGLRDADIARMVDLGLVTVRVIPGTRRRVLLGDVVNVVEGSTFKVNVAVGGAV